MDSPTDPDSQKSEPQRAAAIAGFSRVYVNGQDENLPEVYVDDAPRTVVPAPEDTSPTVVSSEDAKASLPQAVQKNESNTAAPVDDSLKTPVTPTDPETLRDPHPSPPGGSAASSDPNDSKAHPPPRIFGMKRWVFVTLLAVLFIVVAAAVGGGVGGAVASSSSGSSDDDNDEEASTTATETATATTDAPTGSSTPEFLNNQTEPVTEFAFQAFSELNYQGEASAPIVKEGGVNFDFEVVSYVWLPDRSGCCVSFCLNETTDGRVGWRCGARYREEASDFFTRVFVWCAQNVEENAKCAE